MTRLILFFFSTVLFSQVGIGTNNPHSDSDLHLGAQNKTLILNHIDDLNLIKNPIEGMIIYDKSEGCFKGYTDKNWTSCFSSTITNHSFNVKGIGFKGIYKSESTLSNATFEVTLINNSSKEMTLECNVNDLIINIPGLNVTAVYEVGNINKTTTYLDITFLPKSSRTITYKLNGKLSSTDTSIVGIWKKITLSYIDNKEITTN